MSIGYTIRKTGNMLLAMAALAGVCDIGQAYARVALDPAQKAEFDKAPLFSNVVAKGKAERLGEKLCLYPLTSGIATWGILMGFVPGKKGKSR